MGTEGRGTAILAKDIYLLAYNACLRDEEYQHISMESG